MRAITLFQLRAAATVIILGVVLGTFGAVRTGSILIAAGTGVIAAAQ
jgi:hypothetical protein